MPQMRQGSLWNVSLSLVGERTGGIMRKQRLFLLLSVTILPLAGCGGKENQVTEEQNVETETQTILEALSEIIFHTEAVPRVNMMIQKLKSGRIATFDDYLKNSDEKELEKVMSFLKGQKKGNDNLHTAEAAKAGEALEGLMEKVGLYAMEKKTVSVEDIKENFSLEKEQAQQVVDQLERIGVLAKEDNGQHKVIMDKDAFLNRIRSYKELAQRMRAALTLTSRKLKR